MNDILFDAMAVLSDLRNAGAILNDGHLLKTGHGHVPFNHRPGWKAVVGFAAA